MGGWTIHSAKNRRGYAGRWDDPPTTRHKRDHQYRYAGVNRSDSCLAEAQPLTHIEALELNVVPEHLVVIGGGYVGAEMSQAMRRFGSKVSVIDRNQRLMSKEDEDVC